EGPIETALAEIWARVLRTEKVGRTDDFFELGGHSLMALQVVSQLRDRFGLELPLKTLFQARRLDDLVAEIDRAVAAREYTPPVPPLTASSHRGPVPLSYSQERMWLIQSLDPENTAYNMAIAVRITGPLAADALAQAFDRLIE